MTVYRGCQIPPELLFDVERDVWIQFDTDGTATLGMTDVAQTRCGKLVHVLFKKPGVTVKQGRAAATIESAKWVGPFPMPFDGEILETNSTGYDEDILLLNKDPYGTGWLVKVRPTGGEDQQTHLLSGEDAAAAYRERIEELQVNCLRCIDDGTLVSFE